MFSGFPQASHLEYNMSMQSHTSIFISLLHVPKYTLIPKKCNYKVPICPEAPDFLNQSKRKKTTYALKTPSVVALPFIYGVEYIIISN